MSEQIVPRFRPGEIRGRQRVALIRVVFDEKAQGFGLPVRCDIPSEFLDLMNLYPQPVRRQPTVEYLPEHRRYGGFRGNRD